jgi:PDZ domain
MSPPKHLWSGDWREDSAAAAEALGRRRPKSDKQPSSEAPTEVRPRVERPTVAPRPASAPETRLFRAPEAKPRPVQAAAPPTRPLRATAPPARPPTAPRPKAPAQPQPRRSSPQGPGRRPGVRTLIVFAISALVVAGAALALGSALGGHSQTPSLSGSSRPWLGVQMEDLPVGGVTVTTVVPNGPADNAGISPGDVITQINNQQVNTTADVNSALSGLQAGQQVEIQLQRGPLTYTTEATLASWPQGGP